MLENTQNLYDEIRATASLADNGLLWAFCKGLQAEHSDAIKAAKLSTGEAQDVAALFDDKPRLKEEVLKHLFAESSRGNAAASEKLARLAGLGVEDQTLNIEIVDFAPVVVECPHCGENVYRPVEETDASQPKTTEAKK